MDQELYSSVQQELQEGRLSEALGLLMKAAEHQDKTIQKDILLLKSKFEYARNQYEVKGVMTDQEFNIQYSKTMVGVQDILDRMQSGSASPEAFEQKISYRPFLGLVGLLALILTGWLLWPDGSEPGPETDQLADTSITNPPLKQDPEVGTITAPILEPEAGAGSTNTATKPPPVSTEVAKEIEEQTTQPLTEAEKPIVQKEEKAPDPVPAQTFKVNIIRKSSMSDAKVYVDDQQAIVLNETPTIVTIRVTKKPDMHVFELRRNGENTDCKKALLITEDNQRINFTCN